MAAGLRTIPGCGRGLTLPSPKGIGRRGEAAPEGSIRWPIVAWRSQGG